MVSLTDLSRSPICLLDDDPSVLKATGRLLASAGWTVKTFSEPTSFLAFVRTERPRVVIIDMAMPLMHGLEVQSHVREVSPATRVIVLTAHDDKAIREKALAAGATAFFVKPEREEEFLAGVQAAFSAS